jgi:lipoprotein-anchoring transpeptidase ErfK/SrfK
MLRLPVPVIAAAFFVGSAAASAQAISYGPPGQPVPTTPPMVVMVPAPPPMHTDLGGGFIQFLFGRNGPQPLVAAPPPNLYPSAPPQQAYVSPPPTIYSGPERPAGQKMDPRFLPREVAYDGTEMPGTIVVDTPRHFLYLVEKDGKALRYGVGVGREGFTWSGDYHIASKKKWPDWVPPKEMIARQPYLPRFMPGGPDNPLGARALYIGNTLYRIHGSNEPWTIGHNVSSGCIRMRNADVIDLYDRVNIGTKVVVRPMNPSAQVGTEKTRPKSKTPTAG